MNSKELMIGDWLSYNDKFVRISSLQGIIITQPIGTSAYEEEYFAIPLSDEIIELNGFVWNNRTGTYENGTEFSITIPPDNNSNRFRVYCGKSIWGFKIDYVHELQHILRMCGFIELSENFKVPLR